MAKKPSEVAVQRIQVNRFGLPVMVPGVSLLGAAGGLAGIDPVGGPVAGAFEACVVNEGFDQRQAMTVAALPLSAQAGKTRCEHFGGQMLDAHPLGDQKRHKL